jgi:hypothetical protein
MSRFSRLAAGVLLLVSALAFPVASSGQARNGVTGTWGYSGAPQEGESIVRGAIEPVLSMMRPDLQNVARERIAESTWLPTRIRIASRRGRVEVALTGAERRTFSSVLGRPVQVPMRHGYAELTQFIRSDGALQQEFVAIDGRQHNLYLPQPNRTMLLDVTLESPQLPSPIHFQLAYRRAR